jgi:DNA replication protein
MKELRNEFLTKDFIVNSNIIKSISNIDITLDEFLMILYFINVSYNLDVESIKDKLGFNEEKAVNVFSSLINKKYIEMVVSNVNGNVVEVVNLEPLLDRLVLNKRTEDINTDIYAIFESELGRTLSSFEYEMINDWLNKGTSEETIKEALKEAILNNVRNFRYIDKIIYEWNRNGVKKRIKEEKTNVDMFDYDWTSENE